MLGTFRMIDVMEGAMNCVVNYGNVKRGEKVLVITDTKSDFRRAEAVAMACREVGAEVTVMIMKAQDLPNQEPPKAVAEAMKAVDVIFAPLYLTISHTNARFDANKMGVAYMGMYGTELDEFTTPGAKFPTEIIFEVARKTAKLWQNGKTIRITCDKGTDLTAKILNPYDYFNGEGVVLEEGGDPVFFRRGKRLFCNFAGGFGNVGMWPEWTTEGVIYFDAAHTFKGRLKTPVKYTVEKGRVVKFEGDPEQVIFYEGIVKRFGEGARHLAELMIGLNPGARVFFDDPTHMEAHRHSGGLHVAIGMSTENPMAKKNRSVNPGIHLDNYVEKPTIYIDNTLMVDKGKMPIYYEDPEILALLKKYQIQL